MTWHPRDREQEESIGISLKSSYSPMKYGENEKDLWSVPLIQVFQSLRPAVLLEAKIPNEIHPLPRVVLYWRMQLPQQLDLVQAYTVIIMMT